MAKKYDDQNASVPSARKILSQLKIIYNNVDSYIQSPFQIQVKDYQFTKAMVMKFNEIQEQLKRQKLFHTPEEREILDYREAILSKMLPYQLAIDKVDLKSMELDDVLEKITNYGTEIIFKKKYEQYNDYLQQLEEFLHEDQVFLEHPIVKVTTPLHNRFVKTMTMQKVMIESIQQQLVKHPTKEPKIVEFYKDFLRIYAESNGLDLENNNMRDFINEYKASLSNTMDIAEATQILSQSIKEPNREHLLDLVDYFLHTHYKMTKKCLHNPVLLPTKITEDFIKFCKDIMKVSGESTPDPRINIVREFVYDIDPDINTITDNIHHINLNTASGISYEHNYDHASANRNFLGGNYETTE